METGPIIIQIHSDLPGEESKTLYPAKIVWSYKSWRLKQKMKTVNVISYDRKENNRGNVRIILQLFCSCNVSNLKRQRGTMKECLSKRPEWRMDGWMRIGWADRERRSQTDKHNKIQETKKVQLHLGLNEKQMWLAFTWSCTWSLAVDQN